jgi:RNA polymerase sigma-70 factor (ECF subfamily)
VTELLRASRQGDREATDRLIPLVYQHLHALASRYMRRERQDHTLTPTALLNEAYLKLAGTHTEWQDRSHFFVIASHIMRQILVDHAKTRNRLKRGAGGHKVGLDEIDLPAPAGGSILELDEALTRFARQDERNRAITHLRARGRDNSLERIDVLPSPVRDRADTEQQPHRDAAGASGPTPSPQI